MEKTHMYSLGKRQSLPDELAQVITRQIQDGEYAVGDVLPTEQSLAEYFQVSRPVVREALARLKSEGLVQSKRGRGAIVCQNYPNPSYDLNVETLSPEELGQFLDFRIIIEGESAFRAAQNRSPVQLAMLQKHLDDIERSIKTGGSGTNADYDFHCLLALSSGNPYLADFLRFMAAKLWLGVYQARFLSNKNHSSAMLVLDEHRAILKAVREKDGPQARLAMQEHLTKSALRQGLPLRTVKIK